MNNSPSFQFYAQDFLTGVVYLTNEEIGIYIKMLCKQWTDGKIPKKRLGLLVGLEWDSFSEELKNKFVDDGIYLINSRLEKERDKKKTFLKRQSENGKKGGRPPKNEENPIDLKTQTKAKKSLYEEEEEEEKENEDEKGNKEKGGVGEKTSENDYQKIIDVFNSVCLNVPKVQKVTKQRKASINCRVSEYGLEKIGAVFELVSKSKFLSGENERGWTADFDWVMNPNNFIKILEGKYNGKAKQNNNNQAGASDEFRAKTAKRLGLV